MVKDNDGARQALRSVGGQEQPPSLSIVERLNAPSTKTKSKDDEFSAWHGGGYWDYAIKDGSPVKCRNMVVVSEQAISKLRPLIRLQGRQKALDGALLHASVQIGYEVISQRAEIKTFAALRKEHEALGDCGGIVHTPDVALGHVLRSLDYGKHLGNITRQFQVREQLAAGVKEMALDIAEPFQNMIVICCCACWAIEPTYSQETRDDSTRYVDGFMECLDTLSCGARAMLDRLYTRMSRPMARQETA